MGDHPYQCPRYSIFWGPVPISPGIDPTASEDASQIPNVAQTAVDALPGTLRLSTDIAGGSTAEMMLRGTRDKSLLAESDCGDRARAREAFRMSAVHQRDITSFMNPISSCIISAHHVFCIRI